MAKTIKKHWDIAVVVGIGLTLAIVGIVVMSGMMALPSSVSAATETKEVVVTATVAETISLTITGQGIGVAINGATTTLNLSATTDIPFGTLSVSSNPIGGQELKVSTNCAGYKLTVKDEANGLYSSTVTETIDDCPGSYASPADFPATGTEAFGYTVDSGIFASNKWAALTDTANEIASSTTPVTDDATKAAYQAGISATTPAATDYTDTITYTATGPY